MNTKIGTLSESSLHAALRDFYSQPGDVVEAKVGRYVVDIQRGDRIIEIQTGNFASLRRKLPALLEKYDVCLVYPIPYERHILRIAKDGVTQTSHRKSPKRGRVEDVFSELLYIPVIETHERFRLDVVMVKDEVVWVDDGLGSWTRKKWSIADRKLLAVLECHPFRQASDYLRLLPAGLPQSFTVKKVAQADYLPGHVAQKMVYCLCKMGILRQVGMQQRSKLYSVNL